MIVNLQSKLGFLALALIHPALVYSQGANNDGIETSSYLAALLRNPRTGEWNYPKVPRDPKPSTTYFGTVVPEPYASLENHVSSSTLRYQKEQYQFTRNYVSQERNRYNIDYRLKQLHSVQRFGSKQTVNGTTFELYNDGYHQQLVLTKIRSDGTRVNLVDPSLEYERTHTMIRAYTPSPDGKYVAYSLSRKGSDWEEVHVVQTNGKKLPVKITWSKFNSEFEWLQDSSGFSYNQFRQPEGFTLDQAGLETGLSEYLDTKVYKLDGSTSRTAEQSDINSRIVVDHNVEGKQGVPIKLQTVDQRFSIYQVKGDELNNFRAKVYYKDINSRSIGLQQVLSQHPNAYKEVVKVEGTTLTLITDIEADNRRLVNVNLAEPDTIIEAIPQLPNRVLINTVYGTKDKIVGIYTWDALSFLELFDKATNKHIGSIPTEFGNVIGAELVKDDTEIVYRILSFNTVESKYSYNLITKQTKLVSEIKIPGFDKSNFVQRQAYFKSYNNTEISTIFFHKKGLKPDGSHPVLVYAYGGFRSQQQPFYNPRWVYLAENENAVIAIISIRGGYERGEDWYQAGRLFNKQRSYDDMGSAIKFFQTDKDYKFGSEKSIFVNGRSNGGLMTSTVCTQNPTKLGGCIAEVGVNDLLKFPLYTVGDGWVEDYGNATNTKAEFDNILKISPLHTVLKTEPKNKKTYPNLWISAGEYDDRVVKLHSFKLAAEIQHQHRYAKNPALLYIHWNSGHGTGRSVDNLRLADLDVISFIRLSIKRNNHY